MSPEATDSAETRFRCPRCHYDLSGHVRRWTDSCPLRDRCPECGLEFRWRDVLIPRWNLPDWSFEHADRRRIDRLARTTLRALTGRALWTGITVSTPIVASRLLLFILIPVVTTHAVLSLLVISRAADSPNIGVFWKTALWRSEVLYPALAWPYARPIPGLKNAWIDLAIFRWTAMLWILMPLLMLILGGSLRREKLQRIHILRGAAYSAPVATVLAWGTVAFVIVSEKGNRVVPFPWLVLFSPMIVCMFGWWWVFNTRYLRLSRPLLITAVLMLVDVFACVVVSIWLTF